MSNPNHDPKNGEFTSGGAGGAPHHRDATAAEHAKLAPASSQKLSLAEKRAINDHVFRQTRFMNKIEGDGTKFTSSPPFPEVAQASNSSQTQAVFRAANKMDPAQFRQFETHIRKK